MKNRIKTVFLWFLNKPDSAINFEKKSRKGISFSKNTRYTFFRNKGIYILLGGSIPVVCLLMTGSGRIMENMSYDQLLLALKARLRLEDGLGISYVSGVAIGDGFEQKLAVIAREARARPSVGRSATVEAGTAAAARSVRVQPPRPNAHSEDSPRPSGGGLAEEAGAILSEIVSLVPLGDVRSCPDREAILVPHRESALDCTACALCEKRKNVVWGEGAMDAAVMFVGGAPGREEDEQGRPFVDHAGKLLTDIIEKGMKLLRQEVFIAYIVKCRPPGGRQPKNTEIAACGEFLTRQIEVVAPRVLVALGDAAGCALLELPQKTRGLRGTWHEYRGIPLRVTHNPADLLRQRGDGGRRSQADREAWEDIQLVMAKARSGNDTGAGE